MTIREIKMSSIFLPLYYAVSSRVTWRKNIITSYIAFLYNRSFEYSFIFISLIFLNFNYASIIKILIVTGAFFLYFYNFYEALYIYNDQFSVLKEKNSPNRRIVVLGINFKKWLSLFIVKFTISSIFLLCCHILKLINLGNVLVIFLLSIIFSIIYFYYNYLSENKRVFLFPLLTNLKLAVYLVFLSAVVSLFGMIGYIFLLYNLSAFTTYVLYIIRKSDDLSKYKEINNNFWILQNKLNLAFSLVAIPISLFLLFFNESISALLISVFSIINLIPVVRKFCRWVN